MELCGFCQIEVPDTASVCAACGARRKRYGLITHAILYTFLIPIPAFGLAFSGPARDGVNWFGIAFLFAIPLLWALTYWRVKKNGSFAVWTR